MAGIMDVLSGFGNLKPETQGMIIGGGADIISAILAAKAQGKLSAAEANALRAKAMSDVYQQSGRNTLDYATSRDQTERLGYGQALDAIKGPHELAAGRQAMALQRALLFGGPGGAPQYMRPSGVMSRYMGNLPNVSAAKPFYSDSAILASEEPYWQAIAGSTGGKVRPNFEGSGFNAQDASQVQNRMNTYADQRATDVADRESATRNALQRSEAMSIQALQAALQQGKEKPKTSLWGKIGRGLLAGGAVAAGLLTGGASLSTLPAILSMGSAGLSGAFGQGNPWIGAGLNFAGGALGAGLLPSRGASQVALNNALGSGVAPSLWGQPGQLSGTVNSGKALRGVRF